MDFRVREVDSANVYSIRVPDNGGKYLFFTFHQTNNVMALLPPESV
jgi:hypothetical protein